MSAPTFGQMFRSRIETASTGNPYIGTGEFYANSREMQRYNKRNKFGTSRTPLQIAQSLGLD